MNVLLTGATGQVGSQLARLLPALGVTVLAGRERLDLARPDSIRDAIREARPDVIVNAAGYTRVDHCEAEPRLVHAVNAIAPGIMAEEAKRLGALLVHYSSVYVFDGTAPHAYTETDRPHPINVYGRSKLAGEEAVAAAGAEALVFRASWVYDVGSRNFVTTMLKLASEREELAVVDDQRGSPTWARAIAEATVAVLRDATRAKDAAGLYHLAARGSVTRYDFTRSTLELTRSLRATEPRLTRIRTPDYVLPAARPLNSMLDTSRFAATFAVPLDDWETQLRGCLDELSRPGACRRVRTLSS